MKKFFCLIISFVFLFLLIGNISAYSRSNPSYSLYNNAGGVGGFASFTQSNIDKELCSSGTDFLLQIQPFECEPAVVRSDLLEEQDVTVFCKIGATQINPLISVEAINTINIVGEYPREIKSIGYFPSQSALGYYDFDKTLTSPILNDLGYVAITLRQNPNESSMSNFISGNLTATISYDVENAFGVGQAEFYLPVLNDEEFSNRANQYSFWEGRGYLRAESVDDESATISIYSDVSSSISGKQKVTQVKLEEGETSNQIYIPGFSPCLASMKFELNSVEDPDTRAGLRVNADYVEVNDGSDFLDGKCTVTSLRKDGLNQKVSIKCKEDETNSNFDLFIYPSVKININGEIKSYSVGDYLYTSSESGRAVYLGYVDSNEDSTSVENLYVVLVSLPVEKTKLSDDEISSISTQMNLLFSDVKNTGASVFDASSEVVRKFAGGFIQAAKWTITGQQVQKINFKTSIVSPEYDFLGKKVSLVGFSEGEDNGLVSVVDEEYTLEKTTMPVLGNIVPQEVYKIKNGSVDTGLYFVKSESGSPKLILKKNSLSGIWGLGEFYGKNCDTHQTCSEYDLSKVDIGLADGLFDNIVSGMVLINEGKLVLRRISFEFDSNELYKEYYNNAIKDFETVINSFGGVISDSSSESYGEKALYESILLSERLNQKKEVKQLCMDFIDSYPNSNKPLTMCKDDYSLSNSEVSSRDVLINGKTKTISLETIKEPSYEEYGAEVLIKGSSGKVQSYQLRKGKILYLTGLRTNLPDEALGSEYIQLNSVDGDSAKITVYVAGEGTLNQLFSTNSYTFNLDETKGIGGGYTLTLTDTNSEKVARVSVVPSFNYQRSEAEFGFKIGVEKRSIQLSDEQIDKRINSLNNAISDLEKASDRLNTFNEIAGKTCLATGAVLTIKNFLANSDGKSIARQKVMRNTGGWDDFCASEVSKGNYVSLDECFLRNSNEIDTQVNEMFNVIQSQNEKIKQIELDSLQTGTLTNNIVDQNKFVQSYSQVGVSALDGLGASFIDPQGKGSAININEVKTLLSYDGWNSGIYDIDELKDIELYAILLKNSNDVESKQFYNKTLYSLLYNVQKNAGDYVKRTTFFDTYGVSEGQAGFISVSGKLKTISVSNLKTWKDIKNKYTGGVSVTIPSNSKIFSGTNQDYFIQDNELVYPVINQDDNKQYLLVLSNNYIVSRTFELDNSNNRLVMVTDSVNPLGLAFKQYNEDSYKNTYKNPEIKYYEEEPYKGYPAIVPIDVKNGWYAATKPKLPVGSQISAYDASGRLNSFWLCNVGSNGLQEFSSSGLGDDICEQINVGLPGQTYNQFPGLGESEATKLVNNAVDYIEKAQRAYKNGVNSVRINGQTYKVGEPAVETPVVQCQDFMSPKECNLLFNVCDPVVCPSSRCDFGGAYPVKDVVQSGIIGSIALCLPNYQEGIKIPVCTTGIQAGLDSWISVQRSYKDCLQENLDSGQTIGVCDEIHSVYACEFFWRQSIPLAKVVVPKLINIISGNNLRGGGEYLGLQSSWDNAKASLEYFKQYYAAESYNAFKVRSVDEAGTEVCKSFVSTVYPSSAGLLNSLTTPRSPPQFTGSFDEIPFTTATNPPISQYKVYYHIYSGQDSGAYYRVYLKGGSGSYYQDTTSNRIVNSGYISEGDYASDTVDFTAPSGYTQLCIVVNNQEECGFGKVSTSFAVNYVNDLYLAEQSTSTVKTEEECVSGSASLYSLLNPNFQDVAEGLIDPALYQKGIIRVCATNSPGLGTDASDRTENARWRKVGYCTDTAVGCWLDTDSVKDAIKSLDVESSALNDSAQNYLSELTKSGDYVSNENYSKTLGEIKKESDSSKKIDIINNVLDKVFFSNQKAELYLLRGLAYGDLSALEFAKLEKIRTNVFNVGTVVESSGESCSVPIVSTEIAGMNDARQRVLAAAKKLDQTPALKGSIIQDYDKNGAINCYDSTRYIYATAGVTFSCVYSDKAKKQYNSNGNIVIVGVDSNGKSISEGAKSNDIKYLVNEKSCGLVGLNEKEKLDNIQPGDMLSIIYNDKYGHNVIFIEWVDRNNNLAKIFDWLNVDTQGNRVFGYRTIDLSDSKFSVYLYWKPVISSSGDSTITSTGTGNVNVDSALAKFSSGYSSPDFEFQDGTSYRNIHYKFMNNLWYWFNPKDSFWYPVSESLDNKNIALEDNKQIISSLIGKNYIDGLKVIMDGVVNSNGRTLLGFVNFVNSDPVLKTSNVQFSDGNLFKVVSDKRNELFKYDSQSKVWSYSVLNEDQTGYEYYPVSQIAFNTARNEIVVSGDSRPTGYIPSENLRKIIFYLSKNVNLYEGGAFIFNFSDSSEATLSINSQGLDSWEKNNLGNTDLSRFNDKQLLILYDASNCDFCNSYSECDSNLCAAIGKKLGATCQYDINSQTSDYTGNVHTSATCSAGSGYNDRELRSIYEATQCSNCGDGTANFCDEKECLSIGKRIGKDCSYGFLSCKESTSLSQTTLCNSALSKAEYDSFVKFLDSNNLKISDISCDKIGIVDNHFFELKLSGLGISNTNGLTELPNLELLNLDNNKLSALGNFGSSENLIYLHLDGNQFTDISSILVGLPKNSAGIPQKLEILSLENNCITLSSSEFRNLLSLRANNYYFSGNPRSDC